MSVIVRSGAIRITIGGVEYRGFTGVRVEGPPRPKPAGRTVGAHSCSITFEIAREDYDRLRAVILSPLRRWGVRRQLWARARAARPRVRS